MPPILLILQGYHLDCRKGLKPQRGVPAYGPAPAALQPPLGSPALLLSPLGSVTFGTPGREVMRSAGAGRIFSSRPAAGREKHILFHVCFASVCLRAGLQRSWHRARPELRVCHLRMGPRAEGKAPANWMLHFYEI